MTSADLQKISAETIYSPEPALWHPLLLLRRMASETWKFRDLVRRLVVRDMRAQYRQSLLGYLWAFIPPVAAALGFSLARDAQVFVVPGDTRLPYIVFVMTGTVLWQAFIEAVNGPVEALNNFKVVLNRIWLPPEIIIFAKVGEILVNLSIKVALLAIVFAFYGVPVNGITALSPVLLLLLILEGTAIGLVLAPIAALYHDISKALPVLTGFWFILTPVVYTAPKTGLFAALVRANPATHLIVATREAATGGWVEDPWLVAAIGGLSILAFAATLVAFRISIPFVVERAG